MASATSNPEGDEYYDAESSEEGYNLAKRMPEHWSRDDAALHWLQKPHTATVLFVMILGLMYLGFTRDDSLSTVDNYKVGMGSAAFCFLVICMLYLRDGPFMRPHPVVWRLVMGIGILYFLSIVVLYFQSRDDVRQLLTHFDANLGRPLPERSYAQHCELYTPNDPESSFRNLRDTVQDEFFIAHILGWFFKTLIIRDWRFCLFMSVLFEVWEYTFEFMLANFRECWWDHLILDILFCNNLGILTGILVLRYMFRIKEYNWTGVVRWTGRTGSSALRRFTPLSWDRFNWDVMRSPKRFLAVLGVVVHMSVIDLTAFFLKYILWVPPPHYLNIGRLFMWVAIGSASLREWYQFVSDPECHKLGAFVWIGLAGTIAEVMLCIKFGQGIFPDPPPTYVWVPWLVFLVVGSILVVVFFTRQWLYRQRRRRMLIERGGTGDEDDSTPPYFAVSPDAHLVDAYMNLS